MSDSEEDSVSEGFSASEDEWRPAVNMKGGESSDDDDSDFEDSPIASGNSAAANAATRKREPKGRSAAKQASAKKRKPMGQSLRAKLYNKYRPPPKTFPTTSGGVGNNSPSASTSRTASKNAQMPNDSNEDNNDSSGSSVEDYLVNPAELDLQSSFFDVNNINKSKKSPTPDFDCNAGVAHLSDSDSEDNESSADEGKKSKAFDFRNLLEKANSLERAKETIAKRAAETQAKTKAESANTATMDVNSLLALGETNFKRGNKKNENDDDNDEDDAPIKLSKTKSTRIKRATKTRPTSTVAAGDTDDSDWEEVADDAANEDNARGIANAGDTLEIHVDLPSKNRSKTQKQTQEDVEMALKRKLNRNLREKQLLLHKTSLLCYFARSYTYNRLLNDTTLLQASLKLLPSKNSYPPECGTEIKYFQSLVTWFKTAIKLMSPNLYAEKIAKQKTQIKKELLEQIQRKEACCKQDLVFIFIILMRAMGLQCRLVVNMQPLPLKPPQSALLTIKEKKDAAPEQDKSLKSKEKPVDENALRNKASKKSTKTIARSSNVVEKLVFEVAETQMESKNTKPTLSKLKRTQASSVDVKNSSTVSQKRTKPNKAYSVEKSSTKSTKTIDSTNNVNEADKQSQVNSACTAKETKRIEKPAPSKLKSREIERVLEKTASNGLTPVALRTRKALGDNHLHIDSKNVKPPVIVIGVPNTNNDNASAVAMTENANANARQRDTRSRSKSPKAQISAAFLQTKNHRIKFAALPTAAAKPKRAQSKSPSDKVKINAQFLNQAQNTATTATATTTATRTLRSTRQKPSGSNATTLTVPQLDGADDDNIADVKGGRKTHAKRPHLEKLQKSQSSKESVSDEDFEPSPTKRLKQAPVLPKVVQKLRKDRRVLSTDDESESAAGSKKESKRNTTAADIWVEVWSDAEEQWVCVDLFKGKLHSVESIRKSASSSLAYVFAFQNDLSIKDVTARYCPNWATTVRKSRVEKAWLDVAIAQYLGHSTKRDIREDQELRRIHEEKPMPTAISEFKDHPLYALERHLLKFQAIYPPDAPTLGFVRREPVYARDCVHTLHSRDIWLKQARTVKLGEQPYKIVKARPKWDRLTQTVIKDQPLEIFGYWQTQDYEPPTAENGVVPRNAYGNVELFKECMLPKKTVHLKLPGLNRICRKLGIDCASAVIGFDFHQGACHPMFDGFIVCEEFADQVTAAWYQDQEEQERKDQEKYEARVYGNWKKLIRGLLIRERLKKKYNY